jgi:Na+/citrate or Na+/malate symporter
MKFYFIEAAITPGLVMADNGGSGDVSVLSAAGRMHLMPRHSRTASAERSCSC